MRKLAGLLTLLWFCIAPAMAQDQPQGQAQPQDQAQPAKPSPYTPRYEISGAFTHLSFYGPVGSSGVTFGMNGWDGSFDYNLDPWLGAKAEVLGTYNNQGVNGKTTIYEARVGPTFYPFKHRKITVFGQVLVGVGHYSLAFPPQPPFPASTIARTDLAWDVGGGADFYVKKHLGIRLVQLDYDKADFFGGQMSRAGVRVSVGVVYRFGEK